MSAEQYEKFINGLKHIKPPPCEAANALDAAGNRIIKKSICFNRKKCSAEKLACSDFLTFVSSNSGKLIHKDRVATHNIFNRIFSDAEE